MRVTLRGIAAAILITMAAGTPAGAQTALPEAVAPDGAKLFKNQCAACHTVRASDPRRQGPTLEGRRQGQGRILARLFFATDPDGCRIEVIQKGGRYG